MATEHFSDAELACGCGCGLLPPEDHQLELEGLRRVYGRPIRVNSGARCPGHNQRESSTGPNGPHTIGATDMGARGRDARELVQAAAAIGLYRALKERGITVPELLQPLLVRRSVELAFGGLGVAQKGEGRFIHVDHLKDPGHPRPWIWSY